MPSTLTRPTPAPEGEGTYIVLINYDRKGRPAYSAKAHLFDLTGEKFTVCGRGNYSSDFTMTDDLTEARPLCGVCAANDPLA